jgi:hypothetical protein
MVKKLSIGCRIVFGFWFLVGSSITISVQCGMVAPSSSCLLHPKKPAFFFAFSEKVLTLLGGRRK